MSHLTVGELRRQLEGLSHDTELAFEGGMTFYRTKWRGDNLLMIEFNEIQAELSPSFRRRNPDIFVAFCRTEPLEDGEVAKVAYVPRL